MRDMQTDIKSILKNVDLKDPKIQSVVLMALLALIALVLYIYFLFLPQLFGDIRLVGKTLKVRADLKAARALISGKNGLEKKVAEYNEKIDVYEKRLPAQQEIPDLLESLSKMARNADITIVGITPVPPKDQKESGGQIYRELPIVITAKSGYHELGRFLSNLENSDRFMKVVNINVKANPLAPKKHDVDLTVHTYVLSGQ
jgi:type IV pilus assembly protein PilO